MRPLPLLLLAASLAALPGCTAKEEPIDRARDAAVELTDEAKQSLEDAAR